MNYARELPLDKNNYPYPAPPAKTSYQSQNGVPLASSVLSLTPNTTVLQIMVIGGQLGNAAIIGKWGSASVTATNYDFMVNSGQNAPFVVPINTFGTGTQSVAGIQTQLGLYSTVALKTATTQSASVFTAEY